MTAEQSPNGSRQTSSSSGPAWPGWSPPPSSPTPAAASCSSTRRPRRPSAARRSGRSAGSSSSTPPSSAGCGIRDSLELAWQDWLGTAGFDREPRGPLAAAAGRGPTSSSRRARSAAGCASSASGFFPVVGWAERGGGRADGRGNSVPRFHIVWGTGPGIVEPFARRVRAHAAAGRVGCAFRHRVDGLTTSGGAVDGVHGAVLAPDAAERGRPREPRGDRRRSRSRAQAVVVDLAAGSAATTTLVRAELAGPARHRRRRDMLTGVPAHVDGRMLGDHARRRARRRQPRPDVALHRGRRQPLPGLARARHPHPARAVVAVARRARPAAARAALPRLRHPRHARATSRAPGTSTRGSSPTQKIVEKEFALSGSEQNPDLTGSTSAASWAGRGPGVAAPVRGVPGARRGLRRAAHAAPNWSTA